MLTIIMTMTVKPSVLWRNLFQIFRVFEMRLKAHYETQICWLAAEPRESKGMSP
jgi:hypothetical protein